MSLVEYVDGMDYRAGFDTLQGKPKGTGITSSDPAPVMGGAGQSTELSLIRVKTADEFQRALDINTNVSVSYGIFGASAAFRFIEDRKFKSYHVYAIAKVRVLNPLSMIHDIRLDSTASSLLSNNNMPRFREEFGDTFVQGIRTGGAYYALLDFNTSSDEEQQRINGKLDFGVLFFASGDVTFERQLKEIHETATAEIQSYQIGGRDQTQPTEIEQVIQKAQTFANDVRDSGVPFQVLLQDYKTLDYPMQANFVDIENAKEQMNLYSRTRNFLQNKLNDIEFVRDNPDQFKDIGMYDIPGKQRQIEQLLDQLRASASACVNDIHACRYTMPEIPLFELPGRKPETERQALFPDITGRWYADDNGRYYVRQIGNDVWWYAEAQGPPFWTNAFRGKIYGDKIVGDWADVPKNTDSVTNSGKLTLTVDRSGSFFKWTEDLGTPYNARIWRPLVS